MKIAVVGATGRVGSQVARKLLNAGHHVKTLSRGGPALDQLVTLGAEPFLGSFDTGTGELGKFFQDVEAAFLMVRTDWSNIHGHYPVVARRFVDALRHSPVRLAVSLSAIGSDVAGKTGHSEDFYILDQKLNELSNVDLVHLRASWFMENTLTWVGSVAKFGRMAWFFNPDLKMSWVTTDDIAGLASQELTHPTGEHRVIREVGSEHLTMDELAAIISQEIGRPVTYRCIDRSRNDIKEAFLTRFGTLDRWLDDSLWADAYNNGIVRFHAFGPPIRPMLPTTMKSFIRDVWKPRFLDLIASGHEDSETFYSWAARDQVEPGNGLAASILGWRVVN